MGFEQLASLREQLAQQAIAEKIQKQQEKIPEQDKKSQPAAKTPVNPVVRTIGQLQKRFPIAFPKNPAPKVPLKIGIHNDLLEQSEQLGISKKDLRDAIKTWCWGNRYWACIIEDAIRVDLEGNETGRVTKENQLQARKLKAVSQRKKSKQAVAEPVAVETASVEPTEAGAEADPANDRDDV